MKKILLLLTFLVSFNSFSEETPAFNCEEYLKSFGLLLEPQWPQQICPSFQQKSDCASTEGRPIHHFDKVVDHPQGRKILVFGTFHGDEPESTRVVLAWLSRLQNIDPRNSWRIIPLLNPDGLKARSRLNKNGVDLNRNFKTKDWEGNALAYWKNHAKSNPRRFPGEIAESESETKCAVAHIDEFKPDFIVSVHTPYGMLDFDGPSNIDFPKSKLLPWRRLGNFPGSLGRYMWVDRQIPVLTIELGAGKHAHLKLEQMDQLQDLTGLVVQKVTPGHKAHLTKK